MYTRHSLKQATRYFFEYYDGLMFTQSASIPYWEEKLVCGHGQHRCTIELAVHAPWKALKYADLKRLLQLIDSDHRPKGGMEAGYTRPSTPFCWLLAQLRLSFRPPLRLRSRAFGRLVTASPTSFWVRSPASDELVSDDADQGLSSPVCCMCPLARSLHKLA